ncbi:Gfo/Idh/MocA family protein [Microbacterium sp. C23T]
MRIGVLGAAKIADRSSVPAMQATDGLEVVGVAARSASRAAEFAARHDIRSYESYADVIDDSSVDAVYVPLPVGLHFEWSLAALRAGKHVLCEKSLAGSYTDCLTLIEEARARELVLFENFMCERHPQNQFIRDAIADGEIGEIRHASLSFGFPPFPRDDLRNSAELQGGALNDAGAYCLDMAAFYLGAQPSAVTATLSSADYDVDVIGAAFLEFDGGATAAASFGFLHDYRNEARFWGSAGQIDIDRAYSIPADRPPHVTITRNTASERVDLAAADQFALQMARFRDAVRDGDGNAELINRERHARTMEAARISAAEHRRVVVEEVGA